MIPRIAFPLVLCALAIALVAALGAEGRLDRLPPQPYFPAVLSEPHRIACDPEGALWPEQVTDTYWDRPVIDEVESEWFGSHLQAAQETSLSQRPSTQGPQPTRTIRFTWLRSFHAPVVIRIDEASNGGLQLTAKLLSGYGGYGPGRIVRRIERPLTNPEAAALKAKLARIDLFDLTPVGCGGGVDGSEWILEASDATRYHLARRWSPQGGPVHDVGALLLADTGWKLDPIY